MHMPSSALLARRWLLLSLLSLPLARAVARPAEPGALSVRSEKAHFIVRVSGIDHPERLNHLHGFALQLTDGAGKPVTDAKVELFGRRDDSDSALPTSPQVSPAAGNGRYRVEGLRFHMPGAWQLIFAIDSGGIRDRAVLNIIVR
jgi:YtkA-like